MNPDISQRSSSPADAPQVHSSASLYFLYHEIAPQQSDYAYALSTESLQEHLDLFCKIRSSGEAWLRPEITFDDGHASNFAYALPLLSSFALTAHFFVTAGWISQRPEYMTWEQLSELQQAGHRIGAHGWSHKLLTHCSDAELETELSSARRMLEDKLAMPITTLSLPGGRFNRRVLAACERAGYQQVFTSVPRAERSSSAPVMGRLNLRSGVTTAWLEEVLRPGSRALERLERQYRLKEAAQRTLGDRLYSTLWAILNRARADAHPA